MDTKKTVTITKKKGDIYKSIYAYNHAHNYVMAVLELTEQIRERCTGSRKYYSLKVSDYDLNVPRCIKEKIGPQIKLLM